MLISQSKPICRELEAYAQNSFEDVQANAHCPGTRIGRFSGDRLHLNRIARRIRQFLTGRAIARLLQAARIELTSLSSVTFAYAQVR